MKRNNMHLAQLLVTSVAIAASFGTLAFGKRGQTREGNGVTLTVAQIRSIAKAYEKSNQKANTIKLEIRDGREGKIFIRQIVADPDYLFQPMPWIIDSTGQCVPNE